ncbi:FadR/GntR family transcriptional regulator [Arthrobacter sp. MI7-26]|uniref:FadR/GntR family transcriptional regulator n=1 Tax=Arthrobacter sp. MI7-26 TaxID=2993653 RepID=UPI0022496048|nr:FadR/GntR family transcriptional regulator [Arthrobacter sp. MI7-26]MCX2750393.1 FadR/GntR family transcriptional regulator [Arthrobacter sp. MI7-26]
MIEKKRAEKVLKINRVSTVDAVTEEIRGHIQGGEWAVGDRLPSEAELTKTLGVSRASLREATRALVHAGLLAIKQGDGTYVVALDESTVALNRKVTNSKTVEVIEVRSGLDALAVSLAVSRRTEDDLVAIRKALDDRNAGADNADLDAFIEGDLLFHKAIASAAHNELLADLYQSLSLEFRKSIYHAVGEGTEDHEALYRAIDERDTATATKLSSAIIARMEAQPFGNPSSAPQGR